MGLGEKLRDVQYVDELEPSRLNVNTNPNAGSSSTPPLHGTGSFGSDGQVWMFYDSDSDVDDDNEWKITEEYDEHLALRDQLRGKFTEQPTELPLINPEFTTPGSLIQPHLICTAQCGSTRGPDTSHARIDHNSGALAPACKQVSSAIARISYVYTPSHWVFADWVTLPSVICRASEDRVPL